MGAVEPHPPKIDDDLCTHIDQLDGNVSLNSSFCDSDNDATVHNITVQTGYRPHRNPQLSCTRLPPVRRTVRRDNKVLQAVSLPKLSNYNMRSFLPKIENFGIDMHDRNCSLSFLTEVWEKSENKKHQLKIEELLELKGLKYISTPRPGARRGGGAAIVVNTESFSISKLNVHIPKSLEVVWGLMRPVEVTGKITKILVCCFYCPPKSTRKTALIDHMTITLQSLLNTFPKAGIIISGDRNDLGIDRLLTVDPSLRQIVNKGTRGPKVIDVVLTNLSVYFEEPVIVFPIDVDDPAKGVPSDHSGVVVEPRTNAEVPAVKHKVCRTIRPITASAVNNIGQVFVQESWQFLDPSLSPTSLTELFQYYTGEILNTFCPSKVVFSRPNERPWINEDIKILKRRIQRQYERKGKTKMYLDLQQSYELKIENEMQKYTLKIQDELKNGDRSSSYSALRKLGARPGEAAGNTFTLPDHVDQNLSARQSADIIADHFASISQNYDPINLANFPPRMRAELEQPDMSVVPCLEEFEVFKKICKAKKPNSIVPGDLPKKIVQEFSCELSTPVTIIYTSILKTLEYPRQWVVEHQTPLPKVYPPSSEDELRNLAKTAFFSKVFESFLSDWLMPIVGPYLDPCQYGLKGASINHYMFKLLKFIHQFLDLKNPHAVVIALIDLSKAFNRVSHQLVIEDLYDMHVPPWLLLILSSYLTERSMVLTYNGATSSPRSLPGSSPQGAFLGIFFFVVKYNAASLRPVIPRITFNQECRSKLKTCKKVNCTKHAKDMHALYIDDLSEAEAIELKRQLIPDPMQRPMPLNYHERSQQILPTGSILQKNLARIEDFTINNKMKINESKSKIMLFNKSRKFDFPPEFAFKDGEILECLEKTKLLGIFLTSDLKWGAHIREVYLKAISKMWLLRRLKSVKLESDVILDYYLKEIRPLAEHGVVIWNSGLTKGQINDLEKIQKVAFRIILDESYTSYDVACTLLNVSPLQYRRSDLCTKFAIKLYKSPRSNEFFTPAVKLVNTRSELQLLVKESVTNTKRCYNAPHNYLARLVNINKDKIEKST